MNIQEINQLTKASVARLTSDVYLAAFNDAVTGKQFAEKINQLENTKTPAAATRPHGNVRGEEPAPAPAATSFDPSFDESPNAPAPAAAAPAAPAAPAPGNLAIWEYQPTDRQGRPVGGKQVFKYDPSLPNEDPKSLASQLTKAHSFATTALKEKKTKEFIDSVQVEDGGYVEPKMLTVFDHPEYEKLNSITRTAFENAVQGALSLFKQRHPEFVLSESNAAAMVQWVGKSKRDPAAGATWEKAWQALKPHLLPDEVEVAAAPTVEIVEQKVTPVRRGGVPTGLSNSDTFNDEPVVVALITVQGVNVVIDGKNQVLDLRAWDRLPSETQKRVLRNPKNAAAVDALYRAAESKRGKR